MNDVVEDNDDSIIQGEGPKMAPAASVEVACRDFGGGVRVDFPHSGLSADWNGGICSDAQSSPCG